MFTSPWRAWLSASVLSPSAASYVASLQRHGYSAPIAGAYLHAVGHFAYWLTEEHLALRRLDESVVRRFLTTHLPSCRCPGRCQRTVVGVQAALGHLLDVLRADGRIPERRVGLSPAIHDELERFTSYLEQVCGLAAKTRAGRRWWAGQFLADRFGRGPIALDRLTACNIADYLEGHGTRYTPGTAGVRGGALRSYLRFRGARCGDRVESLLAAIPTVASWRLASLPSTSPRTKPLGSWMRLISATRPANAGTPWRTAWWTWACASAKSPPCSWMICIGRTIGAGKSRRADVLPLPVLTGRAIVAYLRQARPPSTSRAVFVRDRAPLDAPITPEIVRYAMRMAFASCGLARYTGTHVLRRTLATQMRQAGASLKHIADVLRHRSLDTTTIYTKLDRPQLATVAAPWPGGVS